MQLLPLKGFVSLLILFSAGLQQSNAQVPPRVNLSPQELKAVDQEPAIENYFSKVSAGEKAEAKEKAQITAAYFFKAVMHRADKAKYPVDENSNSLEKITADMVAELPESVFKKISAKTTALLADNAKRSAVLGKFSQIDLTKKTITQEVKKQTRLEIKPIRKTMLPDLGMHHFTHPGQEELVQVSGPAAGDVFAAAPAAKGFDLVLRAVHCVDETDPEGGSDEIVMSALLIGASGNTNNARGLDCGDFDDGTYRNFGFYPFGYYSMTTTSVFPKVFYCILQLVEVDTDEKDMVLLLNKTLYSIGAAVASAWGLGAIVIAVGEAVDLILGWLIDDDALNVYGIQMTFNSETSLKVNGNTVSMLSGGSSSNWRTGNITGHGGTYRIGFRCQLRY